MKTLYHLKVDHNQSIPLEVQGKVCTLSPQRGFDSLLPDKCESDVA